MNSDELMLLAIEKCREGMAAGQSPFGCAIAMGGEVIAVAHNRVVSDLDITAHAEVVALREACRRRGELFLTGATVASTCEPCPMCMAALHWARVETVCYGARIADARAAGFNEMTVPAAELLRRGESNVQLVEGVRGEECRQLFDDWITNPERVEY
jgi:tRNA(Arg) A34 adenosine deaminase TadA